MILNYNDVKCDSYTAIDIEYHESLAQIRARSRDEDVSKSG